MSALSFSAEELDREQDDSGTPDKHRVSLGDCWLLGDHLLYCGDSENASAVWGLLGEESAACVFTDPPYLLDKPGQPMKYGGLRLTYASLEQASLTQFDPTHFLNVLPCWFREGYLCAYIFHSDQSTLAYLQFAQGQRCRHYQMTWEKEEQPVPLGNSHWKDFELCLRIHKGVTWNHSKEAPHLWRGRSLSTRRIPRRVSGHPTSKPVEWIAPQLLLCTQPGEIVADPYAGSGSTLMACEEIGRRCIAIEHSPAFCDLILARWEATTGRAALHISSSPALTPIPPLVRHSYFLTAPALRLV